VRLEHDWRQGDKVWRYAQLADATTGWFVDEAAAGGAAASRPMGSDAHAEVWRELGHEPLLALRALLAGHATAAARGKRDVLGAPVDELEVWQHGRTTFLGLDADGRIATARFRGRGPSLWFGAVELRFDEWLDRGGVRVPTRVRGTFDGKPEPTFAEQRTGVEVNAALPDDTFRRPQ
jgi:hypothetical protein